MHGKGFLHSDSIAMKFLGRLQPKQGKKDEAMALERIDEGRPPRTDSSVVSSRTGGFETFHRSADLPDEDVSLLDSSVYTNYKTGRKKRGEGDAKSVYSQATTVRMRPSAGPLENIEDIEPKLESYQKAVGGWKPLSPALGAPKQVVIPSPETSRQRSASADEDFSDANMDAATLSMWKNSVEGSTSLAISSLSPVPDRRRLSSSEWSAPSLRGTELVQERYHKAAEAYSAPKLEFRASAEPSMEGRNYIFGWSPCDDNIPRKSFSKAKKSPKSKGKNQKDDDDDNSSVHSFSYSQDSDGQGFELDDALGQVLGSIQASDQLDRAQNPPPPPPLDGFSRFNLDESVERSPDSKRVIDLDDSDSLDLGSKINMSDGTLMEERSPGSLRLTEDGLKRHERKVFGSAKGEEPTDKYLAWKLDKEKEKFYRKKLIEKQEQLVDHNIRVRESHLKKVEIEFERTQSSPKLRLPLPKPKRLAKAMVAPFRTDEDITDISLVPLAELNVAKPPNGGKKSGGKMKVLSLFRRRSEASPAAQELLVKERLAARETKVKKVFMERSEKERIEKRRRAYLEMQRVREADSIRRQIPSTVVEEEAEQGDTQEDARVVTSMDMVRNASRTTTPTHEASTQDLSTLSESPSFPLCIICMKGERTHIALPCMHFSFCGDCAPKLQARKYSDSCPVCATPEVVFASVYV